MTGMGRSRRSVLSAALTGGFLLATVPGLALAQDDVDQDWGVFSRLAKLFDDLRTATNPIADGITRLKFVKFLNGIGKPLTDILREKRSVEAALSIGTCTGDAATMERLAGKSADAIANLLPVLEEKVRILSDAIKPAGSRQMATTLANQLGGLGGRKMWLSRTNSFCSSSPAGRTAFLGQVRGSIAIVESAQKTLDTLIDTLSN